jgi:hypothetical protein
MFRRKLQGRASVFSVFLPSLLVVLAVSSLLFSHSAFASGETFAFTSSTTIHLSGGTANITLDLKATGAPVIYQALFVKNNVQCDTYNITNVQKDSTNGGYSGTIQHQANGCGPALSGNIKIADPNGVGPGGGSKPINPGPGGGTTNPTDTNVTEDATLDCGSTSLNWLVCPVITIAQGAANQLDSFIMNTLNVDVESIFDTTGAGKTTQTAYYKAWNSFRILSTAVIVIAGLVMVSAQALGFEIFGAYTIRKVLPRLIIAIVGISLSWLLMEFVVGFFDTLGFDIRNLIYAPFKNLGGTISVTTGILTTLGAGAAILALGFASLTFILTALLATFVGFLVLVFRQIAIIMLIIVAPFAIACYVLPNTQRLWKMWYDNFLGLMLMFPLLSALIAAGHVFAAVSLQNATTVFVHVFGAASFFVPNGHMFALVNGSVIAQGEGLIAYFAPYFAIPMLARLSIGVVGTFAGFANNMHRGGFDRLKGVRQKTAHENWEQTKGGNRFKGESGLARRANRVLETGTLIPAGGLTLNARKRSARMRTERHQRAGVEAGKFAKESAAFGGFSGDDDVLKAAIDGGDEKGIRAALAAQATYADPDGVVRFHSDHRFANEDTVRASTAQIMRAKREVGEETFMRAAVDALPATGTAFKDNGEMLDYINRAYGDDRAGAGSALARARSASMNAGRVDLGAGGYGAMAGEMTKLYDTRRRTGTVTAADLQASDDAIMESAAASSSAGQAVYGKPQSADRFARTHRRLIERTMGEMNTAAAAGDTASLEAGERQLKLQLADVAGIHDAMASASPQNAKAYADQIMGVSLSTGAMHPTASAAMTRVLGAPQTTPGGTPGMPLSTPQFTVKRAIDHLAGNDNTFIERRRDYATSAVRPTPGAAAAAAAGAPTPGPGGAPGAPGAPGGPPPSDIRFKHAIKPLKQKTRDGIQLYSFKYNWDDSQEYIGVMAQEVLYVRPEAVIADQDGYLFVNYEALGTQMYTREAWDEFIQGRSVQ